MINEQEPLSPVAPVAHAAANPNGVQFVRDLTKPWGMTAQVVQGVSLVVDLAGTGSDPGPTAERSMLISEMQTRGVERPSEVLASPGTSLAMVRGQIPPGARKGDRFDLEVRVPAGSETSSLHGGWLMQTRLREFAKLNNRLSTGHVLGHASGSVLTDDFLEGDGDPMFRKRGRVLGGGVVGKDRNLGLVLRSEFTSVKASAQIGRAINDRFHMFHRGNKEGVATPKRDNFVELRIHPRYKDNIVRYLRVVQHIVVRESPSELTDRLERLRARLASRETAAMAAVQLEAIGDAAIGVLTDALALNDPEIQFYAAEALAYLDESAAAEPLMIAVRDEPAFRWRALTALGSMDDINAHEMLIELLSDSSAETRYGAFRMLRRLTPDDPVIRGQVVDDKFFFHVVSAGGPPLVHIAKHERPEIVLFGADHALREPVVLFAGNEIVIRSNDSGGLTLKQLTAGEDDRALQVELDLAKMVGAIVELGGGYPEVVQAIGEAKSTGALLSRLEFSALPELGRIYTRDDVSVESEPSNVGPGDQAASNNPVAHVVHSAASSEPRRDAGSSTAIDFGDHPTESGPARPATVVSRRSATQRRPQAPATAKLDLDLNDEYRDELSFSDRVASEQRLSHPAEPSVGVSGPPSRQPEFSDLVDPAGR